MAIGNEKENGSGEWECVVFFRLDRDSEHVSALYASERNSWKHTTNILAAMFGME